MLARSNVLAPRESLAVLAKKTPSNVASERPEDKGDPADIASMLSERRHLEVSARYSDAWPSADHQLW